MKGLSTFKPALFHEKGGIKTILDNKFVVAVAGDTAGLSEQAQKIHAWLITENKPVQVRDVIWAHGYWDRRYEHKSLRGFPLEELVDASLLYVEDAK